MEKVQAYFANFEAMKEITHSLCHLQIFERKQAADLNFKITLQKAQSHKAEHPGFIAP